MVSSNYNPPSFENKEKSQEDYDEILNIILTYQDRVPNWREQWGTCIFPLILNPNRLNHVYALRVRRSFIIARAWAENVDQNHKA